MKQSVINLLRAYVDQPFWRYLTFLENVLNIFGKCFKHFPFFRIREKSAFAQFPSIYYYKT